jgi:hypothetical protein
MSMLTRNHHGHVRGSDTDGPEGIAGTVKNLSEQATVTVTDFFVGVV